LPNTPRVESEEEPFNPLRPGWQARSACHPTVMPHVWQQFDDCKHPVDLFFPVGTLKRGRREAIRSVCGTCPVKAECLDWGVAHESYGWYGGFSPIEIEAERARRGVWVDTPEVDSGSTRMVIGTFYPPSHGTPARYTQHRRDGEEPCDACQEGRAAALREKNAVRYEAWKQTATEEEKAAVRAVNRARRAKARAEGRLHVRG
jgi:WhiB family transcriptional regulator, redox-sensing transcriptional regulator